MRISIGAARRADKQLARNMDLILGWIECTARHNHDPEWDPAVKAAARALLDALIDSGAVVDDGQTPTQRGYNAAVGAGPR